VVFDVLYVSPHSDDVGFSAAAQIARDVASGLKIALLTVFEMPETGQSGAGGERAIRRAEDDAYATLAGIQRFSAGLLDAAARHPRYRNNLYRVLAPLREDEKPTVEAVRARIEAFVRDGCPRVVAPLGVGEHVDHQIVHEAANGVVGAEVTFYEDTPYVLTRFALARRLARLGFRPVSDGGAAASEANDPTLRRGSAWEEMVAVVKAWWSLPQVDSWLGVTPERRRTWWLAIARSLLIAYLLGPFVLMPRRLRRLRPVRAAAASLVRGNDVARVKLSAIGVYESQWHYFHYTLEDWRDALERYALLLREEGVVERVWRVVQTGVVTR
jgi:LmbE family N-acetylglucosaminyl deacetylase